MIGVFDSGFGGLTILRAFVGYKNKDRGPSLGGYDYVYLGDNARTPYGNKSEEVIYNYTAEAVNFLFKAGCRIIVVACNTASAKALRRIQREWLPERYPDRKVLGVLIPIAEAAAETTRTGRIGIIGTRATIESGAYERELNKLKPGLEIFSRPAPLLVPLVEEEWLGKPETRMILKKYLRPFKVKRIDTLILGCTHYEFLYKDTVRIMGKNCKVLDSPGIVADKFLKYLARHPEIETKLSKNKKRIFYTTDDPGKFKNFGNKFLNMGVNEVKRIALT